MDLLSAIVMPIFRAWWEFVSLCMFCGAVGGFLAGWAMVDAGHWPWQLGIFWSGGCAFLLWIAEPTRKRYLRWVRIEGDKP
jgi:hypothetical protein